MTGTRPIGKFDRSCYCIGKAEGLVEFVDFCQFFQSSYVPRAIMHNRRAIPTRR